MSDLISRQAAINAADRADYTGLTVEDVKKVTDEVVKELKQLPSAQPEREKGEWIDLGKDKNIRWQCSKCGRRDTHIYNYCPDCGSDNSWRGYER